MTPSWIVLIPPVLVLGLAFVTHDIVASLAVGIATGVLIASKLNPIAGLQVLFHNTSIQLLDIDKLSIFCFLIALGALITLINKTGSAKAFSDKITQRIKHKKVVKGYSFLLSICLFIDDYLNSLTVGYIMHPLTDKFKIPRAKLAYLVDSLTGPVAIVIPVSSWVATILTNLEAAGISTKPTSTSLVTLEPLQAYIWSIPFIFYSFLTIMTVCLLVLTHVSFGPMAKQEQIAENTGNLYGGKKPLHMPSYERNLNHAAYLSDFFIPLCVLMFSVFVGLRVYGYGAIFNILLASASISLTIGIALGIHHKTIKLSEIKGIMVEGYNLMIGAIITIFVANVFALILKNDLHTGEFLAQLVAGSIPLALIPVILFLLSLSIALATGTSWGTMALMLPIAIPPLISLSGALAPCDLSSVPLLLPSIGAILSGAVAGDHISPISETTVMAATSTGCYLGDHISTQWWYAVPVLISTGIGYLLLGIFLPFGLVKACLYSLLASVITCISLLLTLNKWWK